MYATSCLLVFICFQSDRGVPTVPPDPVVQDADLLQKRALHAECCLHQTSPHPVPQARDWSVALPVFAESGKQARHSIHLQHRWSSTVESLSLRPPQKMVLEELVFDQGFICTETGMERFHKRSLKGGGLASWLSLYPYSA